MTTVPIAPSPIARSTRYLPAMISPETGVTGAADRGCVLLPKVSTYYRAIGASRRGQSRRRAAPAGIHPLLSVRRDAAVRDFPKLEAGISECGLPVTVDPARRCAPTE